ncbi:MAG: transposase, partial [Acidiferrobacter sp.]
MATYASERKEAVCRRLMDADGISLAKLARDTGIGESTLYNWRKELHASGALVSPRKTQKSWSSAEKFAAVLETASMNEAERAEYARR